MGNEVEDLRRALAVSEERRVAAEARCAMLEEQVRIVQRDRDAFAQQIRQMMVENPKRILAPRRHDHLGR